MEKQSIFARSIVRRMWRDSTIISILVFLALLIYVVFADLTVSFASVSQAVAGTAAIMIGLSFAMSGFCYYFDFLDTKIGYRKYLGLVGLWFSFLYVVLLLVQNPSKYVYGFFQNLGSADFILGIIALAILISMRIISSVSIMQRIGPANWRLGLRAGYLAYAMLILREVILEGKHWSIWLNSSQGLPPLDMAITLFAVTVLLFRGSMIISQWHRLRRSPHVQTTNAVTPPMQ